MQVVTLTNADTNYDLATLLLAVSANERIHGSQIALQALAANGNDILIGGADMTGTSYGIRLKPGEAVTFSSGSDGATQHLNALQARGVAAGLKIAITNLIS